MVLLQLLPSSSPHRARSALVLMGLPKYWDRSALHLVWDWKMCIQLETVDTSKNQGTPEPPDVSELIQSNHLLLK